MEEPRSIVTEPDMTRKMCSSDVVSIVSVFRRQYCTNAKVPLYNRALSSVAPMAVRPLSLCCIAREASSPPGNIPRGGCPRIATQYRYNVKFNSLLIQIQCVVQLNTQYNVLSRCNKIQTQCIVDQFTRDALCNVYKCNTQK